MASKPMSLSKTDFKRWGWIFLSGLIAYSLDFIVMYILPDLRATDGTTNALVVTVLTLLVDLGRRFVMDTRKVAVSEAKELMTNGKKLLPFILFPFLMALSSAAFAQELVLPNKAQVNSLVKAEVKECPTAELFVWDVIFSDGQTFNPFVEKVQYSTTGESIVFTGPKGKYVVKVRGIGSKEGKASVLCDLDKAVEIVDELPLSPYDPVTPSKPDVTKPEVKPVDPVVVVPEAGKFGLTKLSFDEANKLSKDSKVLSKQFSENFASVSAAINAGGIKNVSTAFSTLVEKNNKTVKENPNSAEWKAWFDLIDSTVKDKMRKSEVKTLDDLADALLEISEGLAPFAKK
jgi:hypothetical protein